MKDIKKPQPKLTQCIEKALSNHIVEMDILSKDSPISKVDIEIHFTSRKRSSSTPVGYHMIITH